MKTENLINDLCLNLKPVKPNYSFNRIFLSWIGISLTTVFLFVWWRSEQFHLIHFPRFIYEIIPLILTSILASYSALQLSVPGTRINHFIPRLPVFFLLTWACFLTLRNFVSESESQDLPYEYHGCVEDFLLMSMMPLFTLIFIIRRRFPVSKSATGFWILSASSTLSAVGESLLCPNEMASHLLSIHFIPVLVVSLFGIFIGKIMFKEYYEMNTKNMTQF